MAVGPHGLPGASGLRRVVATWTDITLWGSGRTYVSRLTGFLGDVNILRHGNGAQESRKGLGERDKCLSALHQLSVLLRLENYVTGKLRECTRARSGPRHPDSRASSCHRGLLEGLPSSVHPTAAEVSCLCCVQTRAVRLPWLLFLLGCSRC